MLMRTMEPYITTREQRVQLKAMTSMLISRYIDAIALRVPDKADGGRVSIRRIEEMEIAMLKQLTWHDVINNLALSTQQHGQKRIIEDLFNTFRQATKDRRTWSTFPIGNREELEDVAAQHGEGTDRDHR